LLIYYATTLGIPITNAIYHHAALATDFWQHSLFVLLTPMIIIIPLLTFRVVRLASSTSR
jgi:hypothetical protein